MAKPPEDSRAVRQQRRRNHESRPPTTDDGIVLNPVDGASVLGDLQIEPIQAPPVAAGRRSTRSPEEKEQTSTPGDEPPVRSEERPPTPEPPAERAVFGGVDSRRLITPTNGYPNRCVCDLVVTYPWTPAGTAFGGTGTFIGPKHVLTAGHVLFEPSQGGWAQTIRVIPGRDGNTWWFGSELLTWPNFKQRSVAGYTEDDDIDYDYGVITLNQGFPVGWFGLMYLSDDNLDSTTAYLIGYPGELGTPNGSQQYAVPGGGALTDYDSTLVYYAMDTSGGQSGAGVYRFWNGERAVFGVHGGQYDSDENRAVRITKFRHDQIRWWQAQDGGWPP